MTTYTHRFNNQKKSAMLEHIQNLEVIETEYFHLQTVIEKFDDKSLTIKAWSVTLAAAIAGSSSFLKGDYILILFASMTSVMFWIIDASWKNFQYANYKRIWEIEKYMRGEIQKIDHLQIATSWNQSFQKLGVKQFFRILLWRHVLIPHGFMSLLLLLLYILLEYNS